MQSFIDKPSLVLALELGHNFLAVNITDPRRGLSCVYSDRIDFDEKEVCPRSLSFAPSSSHLAAFLLTCVQSSLS